MARIKVCPKCKHRNPTSQTICLSCGESIFDVKAISEDVYEKQLAAEKETSAEASLLDTTVSSQEETNIDAQVSVANSTQSDEALKVPEQQDYDNNVQLIKICPNCHVENRGVAKICKNCSQNIKTVKPEKRFLTSPILNNNSDTQSNNVGNLGSQQKTYIGRLASPDSSYSFEIDARHPIVQIGREASMSEYLGDHLYTSRIHAEISVVGEKLAIKDLGKANGTYVNNKRLSPNALTILECGDKVSLGGIWEDDWKNSQAGCFIVYYDD